MAAVLAVGYYAVVGGAAAPGREFFVSPDGSAAGTGASTDPWDLATALAHPPSVQPGDTIWLRGGTYRGLFTSTLRGSPDRPIIVRQHPGERATLDSGRTAADAVLTVQGSDVWFWGFEIMSSSPHRRIPTPGSEALGLERAGGVQVLGPRTRFINLTVHDTSGAFGFWSAAPDAEIYGCLMYYNGWIAPDRGHGEGIYSQNERGQKRIRDNIHFASYGQGIRAYGTEHAAVRGIEFRRNVSFNTGILSGERVSNFLVTVGSGSERIRFEENHSYHPPESGQGSTMLGWIFSGVEKDVVIRGNYFTGGTAGVEVWNWNDVIFEDNTLYSTGGMMALLNHLPEQDRTRYQWDRNHYFGLGDGLMRLNGKNLRWVPWLEASGLDRHSQFTAGAPPNRVFVYPNEYEPGRAHLIVYNWEQRPTVAVDLSGVVSAGNTFEIRDVQNYYGMPVVTGVYRGGTIEIPMTQTEMAQPYGTRAPMHTSPEFGVFVVASPTALR